MIARLKGVVDGVAEDSAIIDVAGVGYLIFASARTLGRLPGLGEAVRLEIETHVREDHIHLYGFSDIGERDWFRLLTSVQGVGARVALAILSVLGPEQLVQAVASADKAAVTRANGVGPKLAGRIVSELKDKIGGMTLGKAAHAPAPDDPSGDTGSASKGGKAKKKGPGGPAGEKAGEAAGEAMGEVSGAGSDKGGGAERHADDAVSALVNLGYGRSEAFGAIARVMHDVSSEADLSELVRLGLKELAS